MKLIELSQKSSIVHLTGVTTGMLLRGFSPYINEETETWYVYDNKTNSFIDSGVVATNRIVSAEMNEDYTITFKFTDGTVFTTRNVRGNGIANIVINADHTLTIFTTDGDKYTTLPVKGEKGDTYTITNADYEAIANITKGKVDLSEYALIRDVPTKVSQLENDKGYLTKHQDLTPYMKNENPTATGSVSVNRKANTDIGTNSVAMGKNTQATAENSIAFGFETDATGEASFAEGASTTASGRHSHAEGRYTQATNQSAHAEGSYSVASGEDSHAEGYSTVAKSNGSHAEGYKTIAKGKGQHVEGTYNIEDSSEKYLHIVGNGTDDTNRANAHTVDKQGNAWYKGDVYVGGNSQDVGSEKLLKTSDINGFAKEEYVNQKISELVNSSPTALDTLKELADALGNDPNFATTITNVLATKTTIDDVKQIVEAYKYLTNLNGVDVTSADYDGDTLKNVITQLKSALEEKIQSVKNIVTDGIIVVDGEVTEHTELAIDTTGDYDRIYTADEVDILIAGKTLVNIEDAWNYVKGV